MTKNYQELINAVKEDETQDNLFALYEWLEKYGRDYFTEGHYETAKELDGRNLYLLFTEDRNIALKLLTQAEYHKTTEYKRMLEFERSERKRREKVGYAQLFGFVSGISTILIILVLLLIKLL